MELQLTVDDLNFIASVLSDHATERAESEDQPDGAHLDPIAAVARPALREPQTYPLDLMTLSQDTARQCGLKPFGEGAQFIYAALLRAAAVPASPSPDEDKNLSRSERECLSERQDLRENRNEAVAIADEPKCSGAHTWTTYFEGDIGYGTRCDCGKKQWGVAAPADPQESK